MSSVLSWIILTAVVTFAILVALIIGYALGWRDSARKTLEYMEESERK